MIVTASALSVALRELIVTVAARHMLPEVHIDRSTVTGGGLFPREPLEVVEDSGNQLLSAGIL